MNICLLTTTSLPLIGGLEMVVHNLANTLKNMGHNVYVITPTHRNHHLNAGYKYRIIHFGFKGYGRLKLVSTSAILTLAYVVIRFKIDVINAHNVFTPCSWAYYLRRLLKKTPLVGTPHGDDIQITPEIQDGVRLDPKADKIVRRNLKDCTRITSISSSIRNDLCEIVGNHKKIIDVPNGVWVRRYQTKLDKVETKKKYNIPINSTVLISVGRNNPRKGFQYGLDAMARLRHEGAEFSYVLVGRNMSPIIEKARMLGISDCLITPGEVDAKTVSELLQVSDIYVSPSIVESFGLTTLEAMSAGLPCVVTNVAGNRDLVSFEHGILVDPANSRDLANAIQYLINTPSECQKMGYKARIESLKYDWTKVAEKYESVYKEAISATANST